MLCSGAPAGNRAIPDRDGKPCSYVIDNAQSPTLGTGPLSEGRDRVVACRRDGLRSPEMDFRLQCAAGVKPQDC